MTREEREALWDPEVIERLEAAFGKWKKLVYLPTGTAHAVPTREIVIHGVKGPDVPGYPLWDEKEHGR